MITSIFSIFFFRIVFQKISTLENINFFAKVHLENNKFSAEIQLENIIFFKMCSTFLHRRLLLNAFSSY